jgi:hypothetical protein
MPGTRNASHDDVNTAFSSQNIVDAPSETLMEYLLILCNTQYRSDENRLLANNRCITINTILTHRLTKQIDRSTRRFTFVTVVLAVVAIAVTIVGIVGAS